MQREIIVSPEAAQDLRRLRAYDRAILLESLEAHLSHEPEKVSRSRIKRLRGLARPQYRLLVGDFRVFYDVAGEEVHVLAIVSKPDAEQWLREAGIPDEESGSVPDQE